MVKNLTKKERLKRNLLKVGEVAKMVGVLRSTIFFYANTGLLKPAEFTQGKYRLFEKGETLTRIAKIRALQDKGLTLEEIRKALGIKK